MNGIELKIFKQQQKQQQRTNKLFCYHFCWKDTIIISAIEAQNYVVFKSNRQLYISYSALMRMVVSWESGIDK